MRHRNGYKLGFTLMEALIAIGIFTIGIEGFSLLFVRSWKLNSYALEMGQSSQAASQGVRGLVDVLRRTRQADDGSYPIRSAGTQDLVFYSDYDKDGTTERLHIYLNNGQVLMGTTKPSSGVPKIYPSGDQTIKMLVDHVVNGATPIFYYYNKDYPGDKVNNPVASPVDVSTIRLVKIFLQININPSRDPNGIQTESFVELRNLNDYDRLQ